RRRGAFPGPGADRRRPADPGDAGRARPGPRDARGRAGAGACARPGPTRVHGGRPGGPRSHRRRIRRRKGRSTRGPRAPAHRAVRRMTPTAGVVSRSAAYLVDGIVVAGITGGAALVAELLGLLAGKRPSGLGRWVVVAMPTVLLIYQTGFWALAGRTPGMALLGIRVLGRAGGLPSWPVALIRAVVVDVFPPGVLWCLVDRRHRSIADLVARTVLIRKE